MSGCGKVWYDSRVRARLAAKRARGRGAPKMTPYECVDTRCPPGTWHLTSQEYDRKYWFREHDRDSMRA